MKLRNTQKQQEYPVGKVERDQRTAGLGEQLKNARENAGLSIQDVANSLKLSPTLVSALENDDYSPLPEPVFVHGYIRNYANIVNLSPDRLLRSYDHGGTPSPNLTVTPTVSTRFQWTDTLVLSALGLSTLLLLALLTLFFPRIESWWANEVIPSGFVDGFPELPERNHGSSNHVFNSNPIVNSVDSLVLNKTDEDSGKRITLDELGMDDVAGSDENQIVTMPEEFDSTIGVDESLSAISTEVVVLTQEDPMGIGIIEVNKHAIESLEVVDHVSVTDLETKGNLILESTGDCWASIKDSSGESVFDGVLKAGEHSFMGVSPLKLILGKPENIAKISYDGIPVDEKKFRVKRVARFSVGEVTNE